MEIHVSRSRTPCMINAAGEVRADKVNEECFEFLWDVCVKARLLK